MEDTTETLTQQEWAIDTHSDVYENDSVIVTTGLGFKFKVTGLKEALQISEAILGDGDIDLPDGTRLRVSWADHRIFLIDSDPWLNPDFEYDQAVARIRDMLWVLIRVARDFS